MPTFLGDFEGAASNRAEKFHRAVQSVWDQSLMNWELIIVVDGCPIAAAEAMRYAGSERITVMKVPKQRRWSGACRNFGLSVATGAYAIYLDSDDRYGPDHLLKVGTGLKAANWPTWGALDEQVWNPTAHQWETRLVMDLLANRSGKIHAGTQNIVHRTDMGIEWPAIEHRAPGFGYAAEDHAMVKSLEKIAAPVYIAGADQYLMHAPGLYDL